MDGPNMMLQTSTINIFVIADPASPIREGYKKMLNSTPEP
jgi:hypothetical protein